MITSLIDFLFIRSLAAHCYSEYGPACYDPSSLFLLDLFRYIDGYQNMSKFLELVRDNDRGRVYRTRFDLTGVSPILAGSFSTGWHSRHLWSIPTRGLH